MKNIHILPTDKPSKLYRNLLTDKLFILENSVMDVSECNREYQNIYITSDEKITESCWCINTIKNNRKPDLIYYQSSMPQYHYVGFKKIILTTDQDLIADDVQSIDDEFLEWFVKNPSCESVPIITTIVNNESAYKTNIGFELWRKEEPKQEILEEAAERKFQNIGDRLIFEDGAKWQQERSYSEEEVYSIVEQAIKDNSRKQLHFFDGGYSNPIYTNLKKWFEQFKKK